MSSKTLTGILEWPERTEGRVRQMGDANRVLEAPDDPFVPAEFGQELPLRSGLRVVRHIGRWRLRLLLPRPHEPGWPLPALCRQVPHVRQRWTRELRQERV